MAPPPKLNEQITKQIELLLEQGLPIGLVAAGVGISRMSLTRWRKKGKEIIAKLEEDSNYEIKPGDERFVALSYAVKRGQTTAKKSMIKCIFDAAMDGKWQSAAWWLERTEREEFSKWSESELCKALDMVVDAVVSGNEKITKALADGLVAGKEKK